MNIEYNDAFDLRGLDVHDRFMVVDIQKKIMTRP